MKQVISVVLFLLYSTHLFAQTDTEFWFAAPEITDLHGDRPIYLRISSLDEAARITISIPANPTIPPIRTFVGIFNTVTVDLTDYIDYLENKPADQVLNKGLFISSTAPVTAYYEVYGMGSSGTAVNCDIWTLKGKNGLGNSFYIPLQNHWDNHDNIEAWSSFDMVATEDNTHITITPTRDLVGHAANIPFTIVLNKGQTYSARALSNLASAHPSGSKVTSDKPIAISIKDDSMYNPPAWDTAGDQLIPTNIIGTEYICNKASDGTNSDRVFICATENNTEVYIDGSTAPEVILNEGETYDYQLTTNQKSLYIKTSLPVYVNHICGFQIELGGAVLPPLICSGSRTVSFARPSYDDLVINLVVKNGGEKYFKLNGKTNIIKASDFSFVNGTNNVWKTAQILISTSLIDAGSIGNVTNDSADFQLSIISGNQDWTFRYGYFSDFAGVSLGSDKTICNGDSVLLNAGYGKTSYQWYVGNDPTIYSTTQKIYALDSTQYKVTITKGVCKVSDSLRVHFYPSVTQKVLGNDTAVCANVGVTITTDTIFSSYLWNTGSTSRSIKPALTGNYSVLVKNKYGCKKSDTLHVTLYTPPSASIHYVGDLETICWDSTITLKTMEGPFKFKWNTGDTTSSITVPISTEYRVSLTDKNHCKDSTSIAIDCSPYVKVYNLITADGNGKNDVFFVENLKPNKWILEIFNRWGDRIYYNKAYNNDFNAEGIENGVYYYSLDHVEGKKSFKGWVQIIKPD